MDSRHLPQPALWRIEVVDHLASRTSRLACFWSGNTGVDHHLPQLPSLDPRKHLSVENLPEFFLRHRNEWRSRHA
jgi:hypothetical protein